MGFKWARKKLTILSRPCPVLQGGNERFPWPAWDWDLYPLYIWMELALVWLLQDVVRVMGFGGEDFGVLEEDPVPCWWLNCLKVMMCGFWGFHSSVIEAFCPVDVTLFHLVITSLSPTVPHFAVLNPVASFWSSVDDHPSHAQIIAALWPFSVPHPWYNQAPLALRY